MLESKKKVYEARRIFSTRM